MTWTIRHFQGTTHVYRLPPAMCYNRSGIIWPRLSPVGTWREMPWYGVCTLCKLTISPEACVRSRILPESSHRLGARAPGKSTKILQFPKDVGHCHSYRRSSGALPFRYYWVFRAVGIYGVTGDRPAPARSGLKRDHFLRSTTFAISGNHKTIIQCVSPNSILSAQPSQEIIRLSCWNPIKISTQIHGHFHFLKIRHPHFLHKFSKSGHLAQCWLSYLEPTGSI